MKDPHARSQPKLHQKHKVTPITPENKSRLHIHISKALQLPSNTLHQHHPLLQTNHFLRTKDPHIQRPILNRNFNINRMLFSVSYNLLKAPVQTYAYQIRRANTLIHKLLGHFKPAIRSLLYSADFLVPLPHWRDADNISILA